MHTTTGASPPDGMATLLARWRADTPGCANRNHLNNAGSALPPATVVQATVDHLILESEMGGYEAADRAAGTVQAAYGGIARLLAAAGTLVIADPVATRVRSEAA